MTKLRVGLLLPYKYKFQNWELRFFEYLLTEKRIKLVVLVRDGRENLGRNSLKTKWKKNTLLSFISKVLFSCQKRIEKFLFPQNITVNEKEIINHFRSIDEKMVFPIEKGFLDIFDDKTCYELEMYNIDVFFRHGFGIIRGPILNIAQHGIWSFHHGDNEVNRGGPAGFWEVAEGADYIGCTLQRLTSELDGGLIIDKAYFNKHWSFIKTQINCYEGSVVLLLKNIKNLLEERIVYNKSPGYDGPLYVSPDMVSLIGYGLRFYFRLARQITCKISRKFFFQENFKWSLYIGKGYFRDSSLFRANKISPPQGEFWADPFIFDYNNEKYVFFENYEYRLNKGKLSCGIITNNTISNIRDVLVKPYHLSYPCIFRHKGVIYMIPETHEKSRIEIYECLEFPLKWKLITYAFENEDIVDTTYFSDNYGQSWLFLNKRLSSTYPMDNELYIYRIDNLREGIFTPHTKNPVIIDSRVARNAGPIFKRGNDFFRPSQQNTQGVYGRGVNINRISLLTINDYKESTEYTAFPNFNKKLHSLHHLSQSDNLHVFDAAQ